MFFSTPLPPLFLTSYPLFGQQIEGECSWKLAAGLLGGSWGGDGWGARMQGGEMMIFWDCGWSLNWGLCWGSHGSGGGQPGASEISKGGG